MSLFGSEFERLLERACSDELLEPDLALNTQLVDITRQKDVKASTALNAIRRKIGQRKPMITLLALNVLEMCVANCGSYFSKEVATQEFMQQMRTWAMGAENDVPPGLRAISGRQSSGYARQPGTFATQQIQNKMLELIQNWAVGFRGDHQYQAIFDVYNKMRVEGFQFPECTVTEAMFRVDQPPDWVEADNCYGCRAAFGPITRKHHCRNCGQIFCQSCSSKEAPIPRFGFEKPVRVCISCYSKLQTSPLGIKGSPGAHLMSSSSMTARNLTADLGPSAAEQAAIAQREEDDLMQAIAASLHEQELREQQQKKMYESYSAPAQPQAAAAPRVESLYNKEPSSESESEETEDSEPDVQNPELAAYLKKGKQVASGSSASLSHAPATADSEAGTKFDSGTILPGGSDSDEALITGLGASLRMLDSKLRNAEMTRRNVALDTSIKSLRNSAIALQPQLLTAMEANEKEKLQALELAAKIQRCIDIRNVLLETRRRHKEEQELLQRMQLEQKLKLMQQQEQYQRLQQSSLHQSMHALPPPGQYGAVPYGMPPPGPYQIQQPAGHPPPEANGSIPLAHPAAPHPYAYQTPPRAPLHTSPQVQYAQYGTAAPSTPPQPQPQQPYPQPQQSYPQTQMQTPPNQAPPLHPIATPPQPMAMPTSMPPPQALPQMPSLQHVATPPQHIAPEQQAQHGDVMHMLSQAPAPPSIQPPQHNPVPQQQQQPELIAFTD